MFHFSGLEGSKRSLSDVFAKRRPESLRPKRLLDHNKKTVVFWRKGTRPKTNMDTQNDGLEKVTPLKHGNF